MPGSIPNKVALLYQTRISNLDNPSKNNLNDNSLDKLNVLFVFKHTNGKKLDSHLWFFMGFCK